MKCPDHHTELGQINYRGILIDECPTCKGRWFDRDELRKAKDSTDDDLRWLDFDPFGTEAGRFEVPSKGRLCPKCSTKMASLTYETSRVTIDKCPQCHGIWLDHGEFEAIVKHLEKTVSSETASEYAQDAFRQFLQVATGPEGAISEVRDFLAVMKLLELRIGVENPRVAGMIQKISQYFPLV